MAHGNQLEFLHLFNPNILPHIRDVAFASQHQVVSDTIEETPGLSPVKIMGLATDGASAMLGVHKGAAAFLRKDNPAMINTHCIAHRGSLAVSTACSEVDLAGEVDTVLHEVSDRMNS